MRKNFYSFVIALTVIAYFALKPELSISQTLKNTYTIFTGPNVYAPNVLVDSQAGGVYKMWYGGWQASGQDRDEIYYRTSTDGINWSNYQAVLTPDQVAQACNQQNGTSINIRHVNNPSVTKLFNNVSKVYQYTMFLPHATSHAHKEAITVFGL